SPNSVMAWALTAQTIAETGARDRQDPDGRGSGRGDGQAVRVRRAQRVHQHVHRGRPAEGQGADGTDRTFLESELGGGVEARLADLYQRTRDLLERNGFVVLALAHALETHKKMLGDDFVSIIEGSRVTS